MEFDLISTNNRYAVNECEEIKSLVILSVGYDVLLEMYNYYYYSCVEYF